MRVPSRPAVLVTGAIATALGWAPLAGAERSTEALAFTCLTCHSAGGGKGAIQDIRGKRPEDILRKIEAFRAGKGDPTIMDRIARGYTEDELRRIAAWLAGGAR